MEKILFVIFSAFVLLLPTAALPAFLDGGPNDYYERSHEHDTYLRLVEHAHLEPAIKILLQGKTFGVVVGDDRSPYTSNPTEVFPDLEFTVRWFPNHPQGLFYIGKVIREHPNGQYVPKNANADIYFERALKFRPKDAMVHYLFAMHKHLTNRKNEALNLYNKAISLKLDTPELHYNLGLLYLDLGDYPHAIEQAQIACIKKYPLKGLINKLRKHKQWDNNFCQ